MCYKYHHSHIHALPNSTFFSLTARCWFMWLQLHSLKTLVVTHSNKDFGLLWSGCMRRHGGWGMTNGGSVPAYRSLKNYFFLYSSKHQHIESQTDKGEPHSARHSPFMPDRRSLLHAVIIDMSKNMAALTVTAHTSVCTCEWKFGKSSPKQISLDIFH